MVEGRSRYTFKRASPSLVLLAAGVEFHDLPSSLTKYQVNHNAEPFPRRMLISHGCATGELDRYLTQRDRGVASDELTKASTELAFCRTLDRRNIMASTLPGTLPGFDDATAVESSSSAVSWSAIIAGAVSAAALTVLLMFLGTGLGLTMVSPWGNQGAGITTFAVSAAIWMIVTQWLSSALGGYMTGRLRARWVGVHTDETFFRDTAHGLLAWALATLLVVCMASTSLTSAVGTGVQAASHVASGAAMGAPSGAASRSDEGTGNNAMSYFVDSLFRPNDPTRLATPGAGGDAATAAQASRILITSATAGEMPPADQTYLAQLVSARTGLSEADATARVNTVLAQVNQAKTKAQAAADTARKAGIAFSLMAALSLVIGAFIASAAAALGGRLRDE